jgi:hypothetical protein
MRTFSRFSRGLQGVLHCIIRACRLTTAVTADIKCLCVLAICCWLSSVGCPVHHVRVSVVYCCVQVDICLCFLLSHYHRYIPRCISTAKATRAWLPGTHTWLPSRYLAPWTLAPYMATAAVQNIIAALSATCTALWQGLELFTAVLWHRGRQECCEVQGDVHSVRLVVCQLRAGCYRPRPAAGPWKLRQVCVVTVAGIGVILRFGLQKLDARRAWGT